jgi:alpha-D-ribose 1-methylphosphonate 5-phosphate C-P lyase
MTYLSQITAADAAAVADHAAYLEAYASAAGRAAHSYFDQHIIQDNDGRYWVADEGDYEPLMQDLIDRIVHTVPAGRLDE